MKKTTHFGSTDMGGGWGVREGGRGEDGCRTGCHQVSDQLLLLVAFFHQASLAGTVLHPHLQQQQFIIAAVAAVNQPPGQKTQPTDEWQPRVDIPSAGTTPTSLNSPDREGGQEPVQRAFFTRPSTHMRTHAETQA